MSKQRGVWAPDCDCDAAEATAKKPVIIQRFPTDHEAMKRYVKLGPLRLHTEANHGPSGHLLAVLDR